MYSSKRRFFQKFSENHSFSLIFVIFSTEIHQFSCFKNYDTTAEDYDSTDEVRPSYHGAYHGANSLNPRMSESLAPSFSAEFHPFSSSISVCLEP